MNLHSLRLTLLLCSALVFTACDNRPATESSTVENPYQLTTVYALEQLDDGPDYVARARYYNAAEILDIWGNVGTIALSPGDAAYVDDVRLDIETRTNTLGTLRVDYSQKVPKKKPSYRFELRRPDGDVYAATIPAPPPPLDVKLDTASSTEVTASWSALPDAQITAQMKSDTCAVQMRAEPPVDGKRDVDTGRRTFSVSLSANQASCRVEITIERRAKTSVTGSWTKNGRGQPVPPSVWSETVERAVRDVTVTR